ncbi:MAG: glycosyltransferase [Prevotella sp.]
MLSVLINAYACSPNMGSEPGMAWNWCVNLAKYCELHIITEGEFKGNIETALLTLPQAENMHFYYNSVPDKVRKICWNQGDWRFYKHYKKWQYKTYEIVLDIIAHNKIDIVHQLNMIGFREPGYLWKIKDIPFVWGPIGGLKQFPILYLKDGGTKMWLFNLIKNGINQLQLKYSRRVHKAINHASVLVSSIPDSYIAIKKSFGLETYIIPETGCFDVEDKQMHNFNNKTLKLLWVGKFDYRKRLDLALRIISSLDIDIQLIICGTGDEKQTSKYKQLCESLKITRKVVWKGFLPNEEVHELMSLADLLLFTSVSEDTSTVVLEAITYQLPVLCFNACGFGYVINDKVGRKVPLTNPIQSIDDFSSIIKHLYDNRDEIKTMSDNCIMTANELSWENKAKQMFEIYKQLV